MKTLPVLLFSCLFAFALRGQQISSDTVAFPDTALARQLLFKGEALRNEGKWDESIATFQQALDIYAKCPSDSFLLEKAHAHFYQGGILAYRGFEKESISQLYAAL
ncbi:MAG: hypothetical protein AAB316_14770, partial [Bacteroidota bacterium]